MDVERQSHLNVQASFASIRKKMAWERSSKQFTAEIRADRARRKERASNQRKEKNEEVGELLTAKPVINKANDKSSKKRKDKSEDLPSASSTMKINTSTRKKQKAHRRESYSHDKSSRPSVRRCHYCKKNRADYIPCTYWHINGKQCKKSFCLSCIAANPKFIQSSEGETEFQCPVCLGTCDCNTCQPMTEQDAITQDARASMKSVPEHSF